MNKTIFIRMLWTALVVWAVPFALAMGFFTPDGGLRTDIFLFKTVMLLVSTPLGLFLMSYHLRRLPGNFTAGGLAAGTVWLLVNWALDFVVLLPLSGMAVDAYFVQIGLRYLAMPMTGYFLGRLLEP